MIPPGGGATVHSYHSIPKSITWELTEIEQKGIKFLIGKAKVCEINAVSSVPILYRRQSLPKLIWNSSMRPKCSDE